VAEIIVTCNHRYTVGSVIKVNSNTNALPYNYTVQQVLQPNDSIQIQDPVQSVFTIGLNGSVWMTRQSLDFSEPNPEWYKVANITGEAQSITMSADGDVIWVGTTGGRVYRITNINLARTTETGDIDEPNPEVEFAQVASYGGRSITGIAVDPNDKDNVVITVGNYGNSSYVYYSSNAMAATPTFASKQGNLPTAPVYCASFDKGNPGYVLVGTEFGMYATDNITAPSVSWTEENMGMPRVPVLSIVQYRTEASSTPDSDVKEGDFFIGTHGRGIYRTNTLQTTRPISIPEEKPLVFDKAQKQLQMFPNPAVHHTTVMFNLMKREDVTVFVRDINGRLVNQLRFNKMAPGKREVRINTSDLAPGTYLLSVQHGEDLQSGKFVVNR
jgi:hypothetical protein